ncbi:hypothetical protein BGZ97_010206 [Linnemannia gamsii]|uniref:Uncharacterized protein n=1 Tax=Linnemannia gamsii TaxID=64522 RepID=A0A9P6QKE0_9FUNG|nr:hypothetical protein BGZ97_010206 [Linnemannia gamsii]
MNSSYMKFMGVVDPITQTSVTIDLPDPQTYFSYRSYYGSVWSKYKRSIIYWGGVNNLLLVPAPAENSVTELVNI